MVNNKSLCFEICNCGYYNEHCSAETEINDECSECKLYFENAMKYDFLERELNRNENN